MAVLTPEKVRQQIAAGDLAPVYLIVGDDEIEKGELVEAFVAGVDPELQPFAVERFYGAEGGPATIHNVVNAARALALLGDRRLVLLLRAEKVLAVRKKPQTSDEDGENEIAARKPDAAAARLEPLVAYVQAPEPRTTLVIVTTHLDRGTRTWKALYQHTTVVECWGLKDGREPPKTWELPRIIEKGQRFVQAEAKKAGIAIDSRAAHMVAHRAGADILRLKGDLQRLLLFAMGSDRITEGDVVQVIGPATSQDDWAVTAAIEKGDAAAALRELALALDAGAEPPMILGQLGWFVREAFDKRKERFRFPDARVPAAAEALFRTDQDLKSSRGNPRILLERLVVELCAARPRA